MSHARFGNLPVADERSHGAREHSNGVLEARAVVDRLGMEVNKCNGDGDGQHRHYIVSTVVKRQASDSPQSEALSAHASYEFCTTSQNAEHPKPIKLPPMMSAESELRSLATLVWIQTYQSSAYPCRFDHQQRSLRRPGLLISDPSRTLKFGELTCPAYAHRCESNLILYVPQ